MIKLFRFLNYKQWLAIALSVVLIVAIVWLELEIPSYMSEITRLLQTGGTANEILFQGIFMLGCALGSAFISIIVGFLAAKVAAGFSKTVRENVYNKIQNFSSNEIKKFSIPSLITRTTNDITQIQTVLAMGLQIIIRAPIMTIWAICIIVNKSWQWSLVTAIAVFVLMLVLVIIILLVMPKFKAIQKQTDNLNKVSRENLTGVRIVRAFNAENFEKVKFEKANNDLTNTNLFTNKVMAVISPTMFLLISGLNLAIYWVGAFLISNAVFPASLTLFSDMIVFSSYAMQIVMSFMMLTMIFIMLPRALVSAKRVNEVLKTESTIFDGTITDSPENKMGEVEFVNVSFKYPDAKEYVIKDISFKANKGDTIAFIGSTGCGKSTIINLIPRFYDATDGEILVDGVNVKDYKLESLNNKIGYVPQKSFLFKGTIFSNINYGKSSKEIDENAVNSAMEISETKPFVNKLEKGVASEITQTGTNVSGGQKQRISIARAIARSPEILIFDDSFSALDYKTDKKVRNNLKKYCKNTTQFVVSQRIGTIKEADLIIVLEDGKIVGKGTHRELLETCEVYNEIALSQLSKEELI